MPFDGKHALRVISLDLDDTLWPIAPVIRRAEAVTRAWLAEQYPEVAAVYERDAVLRLREQVLAEQPDRAHDLTYLRIETLARLAVSCGAPAAVGEEGFEVFIAARNEVELYADVRPALTALCERYVLVALTNGNADLERIGLDDCFAHYVNATGVGAAKPDRRMFDAVTEATGVDAAEVVHVGDDPHHDVVGAAAVGWRTVWLNRARRAWPEEHRPADAELEDLAALVRGLLPE
jgi:putative hydrolase of the HAD superfamily